MTGDPLDRLRACNPVRGDVPAPPIENVLARVHAEAGPPRTQGRGRRITGALVPALGVLAALAVIALAIVLAVHHSRPAATVTNPAPSHPAATSTTSTAAQPTGGMRGQLEMIHTNFAAGQDGVISWEQCSPCHQAATGADVAFHGWLATTADGGASWTIASRPYAFNAPVFSGARDGWSSAVDTGNHLYVTHNGGQDWRRAAGDSGSAGNVSIADGEVWGVTIACGRPACAAQVLRGPASGNRLRATGPLPGQGAADGLAIRAASAREAFVEILGNDVHDYVTRDAGASWQPVSTVCRPRVSTGIEVGGPDSLWELCPTATSRGNRLARSDDGGRTWTTYAPPAGGAPALRLWPMSAAVAWTMTGRGRVLRTADGGASWQTLDPPAGERPRGFRTEPVAFAAQSAQTAVLIATLTPIHASSRTRRFDLIAYRTTDGGHTWRSGVLDLPTG